MGSTKTGAAPAGRPELNHTLEVRAAQIELLYRQAPSALIATLVNAGILALVLRKEIATPRLAGWFLAVAVLVLGRTWQRRRYFMAHPSPADSLRWGRRYLFGVAVNGVLWGYAGFFFFTADGYAHQLFLAFVLGGMAAGAVSTLAPLRGAYLAFLVPALLPYMVRLLIYGGELHLAMAAMVVLFIAMMWMIAGRLHASLEESLRLRFENVDLLQDLTQARDRQERANVELAAEIAEKHGAQRALQASYAELERRVRERTLELAKSEEALREAGRRKDEFLAMLGHELRNPLAPIRNAVEVLRKPGVPDSVLQWSRDVIDRQVNHLARLVDDLLDVSRIIQGKISLHATLLDLAAVIEQAVEASRPLIEGRRHELAVSLPEGPLHVKGDLVRLAQIVSNLLNNAAKYTDTGGRIRLEVEVSENWVVITVRDNGVGIPASLLPQVFDLFIQADQSLARAQGGLGIGLTLVKRLVEMHGGRVEAQSAGPGQGSEFRVWLPRSAAPPAPSGGAASDRIGAAGPKLRVLVVDDNRDVATSLAVVLRLEGHTVDLAFDGPTALDKAEAFRPEAVLLDIGMPGMDGYQVARELRNREATRRAIILAVTGYGQPEDRDCSKNAGFDGHLAKPVDPKVLLGMLSGRKAAA
jgi:signal transduction histidine kinase/ActR/RegA family two-component response regulator